MDAVQKWPKILTSFLFITKLLPNLALTYQWDPSKMAEIMFRALWGNSGVEKHGKFGLLECLLGWLVMKTCHFSRKSSQCAAVAGPVHGISGLRAAPGAQTTPQGPVRIHRQVRPNGAGYKVKVVLKVLHFGPVITCSNLCKVLTVYIV